MYLITRMRECSIIKKYWPAMMSGITITIVFFIFLGRYFDESVVWAIGGLLYQIPIRLFFRSFHAPDLKIDERCINVPDILYQGDKKLRYKKVAIRVKNVGRSSAKNCKGYRYNLHIMSYKKKRNCWTIPSERPNATINSKDEETLDFCAFYLPEPYEGDDTDAPKIIFPDVHGWDNPSEDKDLGDIHESTTEYGLLITSDNAKPVKKIVRFDMRNHDVIITEKSKR